MMDFAVSRITGWRYFSIHNIRSRFCIFERKLQEPVQDSKMHMLINSPGGRFQRDLDFLETQIKGDTENINEGKQWNKRKDKENGAAAQI